MKTPSASPTRLVPFGKLVSVPGDSLYADEFDALMRDLLPRLRALLPSLSDIEVLRAAARMAEYRLSDERTLMDVEFGGWR